MLNSATCCREQTVHVHRCHFAVYFLSLLPIHCHGPNLPAPAKIEGRLCAANWWIESDTEDWNYDGPPSRPGRAAHSPPPASMMQLVVGALLFWGLHLGAVGRLWGDGSEQLSSGAGHQWFGQPQAIVTFCLTYHLYKAWADNVEIEESHEAINFIALLRYHNNCSYYTRNLSPRLQLPSQ